MYMWMILKKSGGLPGVWADPSKGWAGETWVGTEIQYCSPCSSRALETQHQCKGKPTFSQLGCPEGTALSRPFRVPKCLWYWGWRMARQGVGEGWLGWEVFRARHSGLGASANGSGLYPKNNGKLTKSSKCICVWWTDLHFGKDHPDGKVESWL